jgi:hypothetical protein
MELAFSPRAQFTALTVGSAIAISFASAQGSAPSPFLPQDAQAPSKDGAPRTQPSQPPRVNLEGFGTFSGRIDSLATAEPQHGRRRGSGSQGLPGVTGEGYGYSAFSMKL